MKKNFLILLLLVSGLLSAQKSINDYKYVIVPTKYDFLDEENMYRLNTMTKFNLTKIGFTAFYTNEDLPVEIINDRCSKLYVNVEKVKAFLSTKLIITFKDCQNNVIYTSGEGRSKEKEYKVAYPEALNAAFETLNLMKYSYNGKNGGGISNTSAKTAVAKAKEADVPKSSPNIDETKDYLYAQPIANGFQLVDKTPKVVLKIYKTSQPDYFTAQSETKNGAVIKKDGEWILEYYKDERPVSEKLLIKF